MRLRTKLIAIILALLTTITIPAAAQSDPARVALEAARKKEIIDGDLDAAIQQYKAVVDKFKNDRDIAAEALIRMAECYQKLGDAESKKIYERIIRDLPDKKEAVAIARAHVTTAEAPSVAKGDRAVWSDTFVDGFGTISPDGRFLTYTDWAKGSVLMLRDLANGKDRPLTSRDAPARSGAEYSAISKDGKLVAYSWFDGDKPEELRIASLEGAGIPESRRILQSDEIQSILPSDWSPDGRWIAARLLRKDRTVQIAVVSTKDSAVHVLKSTDWSDRHGKVFFSPDGRYLSYEQTSRDSANKSQIFIMAADGGGEAPADPFPSLNQVMGWLPDGKHLLFASDRNGSTGLWTIPVADGKPQGQPVLVKPDIGPTLWSMGITASGALYTWRNTGSIYVQVSPIDLNAGKLQGSPAGIFQRFIESRGRPEWSADGKQLALASCGAGGGERCSLFVWSMKTGQVRELKHQLNYLAYMTWSPDGQALLVKGNDPKGKSGIYRIDADTGATSLIDDGPVGYAQWAPNSKAIYYREGKRRDVILKRDLASGAESDLVRAPEGPFSLSPDGRSIAQISNERSTADVLVISLEAGQIRNVFQVNAPEHIRNLVPVALSWTPDSRAVIVMKTFDGNDRKELWEIPIDGRQPRKLDIDTTHWDEGGFRLSPDGKYLAFVGAAGKSGSEIWAFENLAPTPRSNK